MRGSGLIACNRDRDGLAEGWGCVPPYSTSFLTLSSDPADNGPSAQRPTDTDLRGIPLGRSHGLGLLWGYVWLCILLPPPSSLPHHNAWHKATPVRADASAPESGHPGFTWLRTHLPDQSLIWPPNSQSSNSQCTFYWKNKQTTLITWMECCLYSNKWHFNVDLQ